MGRLIAVEPDAQSDLTHANALTSVSQHSVDEGTLPGLDHRCLLHGRARALQRQLFLRLPLARPRDTRGDAAHDAPGDSFSERAVERPEAILVTNQLTETDTDGKRRHSLPSWPTKKESGAKNLADVFERDEIDGLLDEMTIGTACGYSVRN